MRQIAAFLILVGLFVVLVGTRFKASDGDRLAAVSRVVARQCQEALPPEVNWDRPLQWLRRLVPRQPAEAVRDRLAADRRFAGLELTVVGEGGTIRLRGVVPDARLCREAVILAENTVGVEEVVNELAVPVGREPTSE